VTLIAMTVAAADRATSLHAAVALGSRLFSDTSLSADGTVACSTCHQPDRALSDGRRVAAGVASAAGTRNAPSLVEVARQRSLFWDGRRASLEEQALDPFFNPVEHGLRDGAALLALLRGRSEYVALFARAFPAEKDSISLPNVAAALAAFERTFVDGDSAFDRHLAGRADALTESARRGWLLFSGSARCIRCHVSEGSKPLLTDHAFHAVTAGLEPVQRKLPELARRLVQSHRDGRAKDRTILLDPEVAALGRFAVTLDPADIGRFKTPGLRNVALTAPYMHDGSVPTLAEAVEQEIYYRSAEQGRPLILTPADKADLVAFLESLTGWTPGHAVNALQAKPAPRQPNRAIGGRRAE
jgi:cytochrome c peroxidase